MSSFWITRSSKRSASPSIQRDLFSGKKGAPFGLLVRQPTMSSSSRMITLMLSRMWARARLIRVSGCSFQLAAIDSVR